MGLLASLFNATLPSPQPRDSDGKFMPSRIAVRRKALDMARNMKRDDLVVRLGGEA